VPNSAIGGQVREAFPALAKIQALDCHYDRHSVCGYMIVDAYGKVVAWRLPVHDFRAARGINNPIQPIE
jgi:hypothetical protein